MISVFFSHIYYLYNYEINCHCGAELTRSPGITTHSQRISAGKSIIHNVSPLATGSFLESGTAAGYDSLLCGRNSPLIGRWACKITVALWEIKAYLWGSHTHTRTPRPLQAGTPWLWFSVFRRCRDAPTYGRAVPDHWTESPLCSSPASRAPGGSSPLSAATR